MSTSHGDPLINTAFQVVIAKMIPRCHSLSYFWGKLKDLGELGRKIWSKCLIHSSLFTILSIMAVV